ncbi:MAG: hypothetical protein LBJ98_04450 [Endomicrobium sp.]|jgi:hypothetical protein|nr:hypothetical protein [Endomicrobium sp.]MDR2644487.1 hypothetical protein [Endomicrobium sp.]
MPYNVKIDNYIMKMELNEVPNKCPACGSYVELKIMNSLYVDKYLIVSCICPRDTCKAPVLLNYNNAQEISEFKNIFILDGNKIKCMYSNEEIISNV